MTERLQYKPSSKEEESDEIEFMLDECMREIKDDASIRPFIESINDQFERRHWLSSKQKEALTRIFEGLEYQHD